MRYLLLLLVLVSCARYGGSQNVEINEVSRAILTYGSKVNHDKHLFLDDSVIYYNGAITGIRLDFSLQPVTLTLWESRALLVDTVEGFLDKINNTPEIVAQLEHHPFTADDLEVYINFTSFFGKYIDLQASGLATLRQGTANYFTFSTFACSQDCYEQRREYYWQSKMFLEHYREGEAAVAPKEGPLKSAFDTERYLPAK